MTSACLGGFFGKGSRKLQNKVIDFMQKNNNRCFLEIQHHLVDRQIELNKKLYEIHKETGIRLICGTDTHALNETHAMGRFMLQKAKDIYFSEEEGWDLTFKSYEELIDILKKQNAIPIEEYLEAVNNTNVVADMVEEFTIDKSYKYPILYKDSLSVLKKKINKGVLVRGINKYPNYKSEYVPRIYYELLLT